MREIPNSPGPLLRSWQTGQILFARVLETSPAGQLVLRVGGHHVTASAGISIPRGTVLTLEVGNLAPVPSLKILNAPSAAVAEAPAASLLDRQLQVLLPRTGTVTAPFTTLMDPLQSASILSLAGAQASLLNRLEKSVGRLELLTDPKELQKAIRQSGVFLESDLLQVVRSGGLLPQGDAKAALFKLLQQVDRALSHAGEIAGDNVGLKGLLKLQGELLGALATITLNQYASCRVGERPGARWLFELPVMFDELVHGLLISISQDSASKNEPEELQDWKVLLNVSLPVYGAIEAELFVRGNKVSVVVYAQQPTTVELLEAKLPRLRQGLEQCGLEVSVLLCRQGDCEGINSIAKRPVCVDEHA